jgi:hypothetical protein
MDNDVSRSISSDGVRAEWDHYYDYNDVDLDQIGLDPSDVDSRYNVSLDLSEATYNLSHEIIDINCDFLDEVLSSFIPWNVFSKVFRIHEREVDMSALIQAGYWAGPEVVRSTNGTFMGDSLSFMHLSIYLRSCVFAVTRSGHMPIGQSVGDDLILVGVSESMSNSFESLIRRTGSEPSKFNACSKFALTFCEQFAYKPSDFSRLYDYPKNSIFGDFVFLDIIKGSVLSGKSKVNVTGSDPFFGHARMLNKQLDYHPIEWVKKRAIVFLWVSNYLKCLKLGSSNASLPETLGGAGLAVTAKKDWKDLTFRSQYIAYYEAMLRAPDEAFITFSTLLQGIYKANPKGIPWSGSLSKVEAALDGLQLIKVRDATSLLPEWMTKQPWGRKLAFISKVLKLGSIDHLIDELARREAFQAYWDEAGRPASKPQYMTLPIKASNERHRSVWNEIRKSFQPLPEDSWRSYSIEHLEQRWRGRLWNVFYRKEDVCLSNAFGGMTTLTISY